MTISGGYAGTILFVDLTTRNIEKRLFSEDIARKFIGNRGVNAKLLYDLLGPNTDPLSPQNALIFGTGPFMGTTVPSGGRSDLTFKSPLTGLIASSSSGQSGMIKFAGYDHLVITGRADKPIYLRICDDDVEICDASKIWGKDVYETTDALREDLGSDYNMTVIGPAGERLYRYAPVVNEKYGFYGQQGGGAVMGSKNLKAIAVKGTGKVEVADPKRFKELIAKMFHEMVTSKEWVVPGTSAVEYERFKELGTFVYMDNIEGLPNSHKNWKEIVAWEEQTGILYSEDMFETRIADGQIACTGCPIGCKHRMRIRDGKYKNLAFVASCCAAYVHALGDFCGIKEFDETVKIAEYFARYGMDILASGANIAYALELYERGIITREDTEGLELTWGNAEAIQAFIRKIAYREGIGDVFADGVEMAAKRIGKGAEECAVHFRGLPPNVDNRLGGNNATEPFSQLTNVGRSGHSQLWWATPIGTSGPDKLKKFCRKIGMPQESIDKITDGPFGYNAPVFTKWAEDLWDFINISGFCAAGYTSIRYDIELSAGLYSALTGIEITPAEMMKCAERSWNMQKAFNIREGLPSNPPPKRFMTEPLKHKGGRFEDIPPVDEADTRRALGEYYKERGWDVEKGIPTQGKLVELGLEDLAKDLA